MAEADVEDPLVGLCRAVYECDLLMTSYNLTQLAAGENRLNDEAACPDNPYLHENTPLQIAVKALPPTDNPEERAHNLGVRLVIARLLIIHGAETDAESFITFTTAVQTARDEENGDMVQVLESWDPETRAFTGDEGPGTYTALAREFNEQSMDIAADSILSYAELWLNDHSEYNLWTEKLLHDQRLAAAAAAPAAPAATVDNEEEVDQLASMDEDAPDDDDRRASTREGSEDRGFVDGEFDDEEEDMVMSTTVGEDIDMFWADGPKKVPFVASRQISPATTSADDEQAAKEAEEMLLVDIKPVIPPENMLGLAISNAPLQPPPPSPADPLPQPPPSQQRPQTPPRPTIAKPSAIPPQAPFSLPPDVARTPKLESASPRPSAPVASTSSDSLPPDFLPTYLVIPSLPVEITDSGLRAFVSQYYSDMRTFVQVHLFGKVKKSAFVQFVDKESRDRGILALDKRMLGGVLVDAERWQDKKLGHPQHSNWPQRMKGFIDPPSATLNRVPIPQRPAEAKPSPQLSQSSRESYAPRRPPSRESSASLNRRQRSRTRSRSPVRERDRFAPQRDDNKFARSRDGRRHTPPHASAQRRRSPSSRYRSPSPRRRSPSPLQRSPSPRRRSPSPPRRFSPPRRRSLSPRRRSRSRSPPRPRFSSPITKRRPSPQRRRSPSPVNKRVASNPQKSLPNSPALSKPPPSSNRRDSGTPPRPAPQVPLSGTTTQPTNGHSWPTDIPTGNITSTPPVSASNDSSSLIDDEVEDLNSIGFSSDDRGAFSVVTAPITNPPITNFSRTISSNVIFGYLHPEKAKYLLCQENPYAGRSGGEVDEKMAYAYESWLKAQAGESKDFYTAFFAQLMRFNETNLKFQEMGMGLAEGVGEGDEKREQWNPDGDAKIKFDKWGKVDDEVKMKDVGRKGEERFFSKKTKEMFGVEENVADGANAIVQDG